MPLTTNVVDEDRAVRLALRAMADAHEALGAAEHRLREAGRFGWQAEVRKLDEQVRKLRDHMDAVR